MHVLVVGGTGWVGSWLSRELSRRGWRSTILAAAPASIHGQARVHVGDRRDPRTLKALVTAGPFDAAIDLIAYEPLDSFLLLDLLGSRIGRLVHLSTVSVYRGAASARVTEAAAVRWDDRDGDGYGVRKAACERVVERGAASGGPPCVIVRAAPLLGTGDPVSREGFLVRRLIRRQPILVPGDANATIVMLWVRDLVWALAEAATNPAAAGHSLHLAFAGSRSFAEHVQAIGDLLGVEPELRSVTSETLSAHGMNPYAFPFAPFGGRAWLDCEQARRVLGFEAAPYADALRETVTWLRDLRPGERPAWPGRASIQSRLTGTSDLLYERSERDIRVGVAAVPAVPPERIMDALAGFSGTSPPIDTVASADRPRRVSASVTGRLEAHLEPDRFLSGRAWLYCRHAAEQAHGYRHANAPPAVAIIGFADLDLALREEQAPYVLVEWSRYADRLALSRWLGSAAATGYVGLPAASQRLRIWVERERELAFDGLAAELDLQPAVGRWIGAFAAGRLLTRLDAIPSDPVAVEIPTIVNRPDILVVRVLPARYFAVRPEVSRAWPLSLTAFA